MTNNLISDWVALYKRADGTTRQFKIKNVTGDEAEEIALASVNDDEELMDLC